MITFKVVVALVPQAFIARILTFPAVDPKFTTMDVVPCPDAIVAPVGTCHVYDVAPGTGMMRYTRPACEVETLAGPTIVPGAAGAEPTVTVACAVALHPAAFDAVTVYVVVDAGVTVGFWSDDVHDEEVDEVHAYCVAFVAATWIVAVPPGQIVIFCVAGVMVGGVATVTVALAVAEQFAADTTVAV
jgi:hypothetical protein